MLSNELWVDLPSGKKYPIFIDDESIESLGEKIFKHTNANKILVVISQKVNKLYGNLLNIPNSVKFVLKDGEGQKNFKNFQKIVRFAIKNKLERNDAIVAIGGGVVGDIAGFAAATYLRGIDFIQIPTTLLACVDSSVGGKVAINSNLGKNMVGAFYQPKAVFCNLNFLKTLDERQLKCGMAEVIKYAFIEKNCGVEQDFDLFDFLIANPQRIFSRNTNTLGEIIKISLTLKIAVVKKDEKEQGLRKVLNFGHTLGHAIEKITNYKKFNHGEAISIGMKFAVIVAYERKIIRKSLKVKAFELIDNYKIIKKIPKFNPQKLIQIMESDKKVENGNINFILPVQKSFVEVFNDITNKEIETCLKLLY
ncbi:MAG TPA: 3-dehydroquinate synthase [Candidatus Gastranaerophilaceae bacterium]|nr:3-dehydroquinate synthase [Candidatus Gastranaerophilaceae bacterium]HPT41429.1 3-dehydroquinate synthase [Candidatus Gastranaerophilaceae bacterium]